MLRNPSVLVVVVTLCALPAVAKAPAPQILGEPLPSTSALRSPSQTNAHVTTSTKMHRAQIDAPRIFFPGDAVRAKSHVPEDAAREYVARHLDRFGVHDDDVRRAIVDHELVLDHVLDTGRGGVVASFNRNVGGIEVWRDAVKALMRRDSLELVALSGQLHAALPSVAYANNPDVAFVVDARAAFASSIESVLDARVRATDVHVDTAVDGAGYAHVALDPGSEIALRHGRIKRVWAPEEDVVVPAYVVEIAAQNAARDDFAVRVIVDARDGHLVRVTNLTHYAAYQYRVWADTDGDKRPLDCPYGDVTPYPLAAPDGHYPTAIVPENLVTIDGFDHFADPWIAAGATESTGNNVDAFTDDANPVGFSAGDVRAHVTSDGVFDVAPDFTQASEANDTQKQAGAVALFYLVNWLHDWWYESGFDEKAHNGQTSNYGRGGVENDPILALSQFGAPFARDNSAMNPLDDGANPEMQMFVWSGRDTGQLQANGTNFGFNVADFGPSTYDITTDAIVVDDGTDPDHADACEPITNDLTGKIALLNRGTCTFQSKVFAAEQAGAVAVIVVNNQAGQPPPPVFGDPQDPNAPTIPVVSLTQEDGTSLEQSVQSGTTVSIILQRNQEPDFDGGFDTTVAAHEWMHYMHLRQVACEQSQCAAQSEGWADFNALMTTTRSGDDLDAAFPMGVYDTRAFPDDPAYFGIRRYPYSTDEAKNPLHLGLIANSAQLPDPSVAPIAPDNAAAPNSEAHAAGEVWSEMMFESFIAILKRSSESKAPYDFEGARRRMGDIVEAAMVLAPADPTYTEMRDAVLAGATTFDDVDASTIAAAFAKRGAGTCAVSPARDSTDFEGVVDDTTVGGAYSITSVAIDDGAQSCDGDGLLDAGEEGHVTVTVENKSTETLDGATIQLSSDTVGVHFGQETLSVGRVAPFSSAQVTASISLDANAPALKHGSINAKIVDGPGCSDAKTTGVTVTPLLNGDDVANGLKNDSVEGSKTVWTPQGDFADLIWTIVQHDDGNHVWNGVDADGGPTDTALVSPALTVSATDHFTLKFTHRHAFEADQQSNYDGGVIEFSTDGGSTWTDIATIADPGYEGTIGDVAQQAHNALAGRPGFVGQNASYPNVDVVNVDLGTSLAGQTVQVRFRLDTDEAGGADGWDVDDVTFGGIDNAPFSGLVENKKPCAPSNNNNNGGNNNGKTPNVSGAKGCGCSSSTDAAPVFALSLALAALVRRRQNRRS